MPLAEILNKYYSENSSYEQLFEKSFQESQGTWSISNKKLKSKELAEYYTSLAVRIINENPAAIPDCINFLMEFNQQWTKVRKIQSIDPNSEDSIFFNSKIPEVAFLSNFFPTLILGKAPVDSSLKNTDDTDPSNSMPAVEDKIYYCLETAYLAQRVAQMDFSKAVQIANSIDPLDAKKISTKAKKTFSSIKSSEEDKEEKLGLMEDLLKRKFSQNPILMNFLKNTKKRRLVEKTSDEFWGCGSADNLSSYPGQNNLGLLLEKIREQ
ncbi:MAG: NADAR family protein [Parachlamydiales bacterium]|jgi:ribA/ribD-fused uncharacterized protein